MIKKSTLKSIKVFSFTLVFFGYINNFTQYNYELYFQICRFFNSGFIHSKFFTPFEIVFIILLINIGHYYVVKFNFNNGIFILAFVAFFFRMINPNSETINPILGMPLLSNLGEYTFLFMILTFVSIRPDICKLIIEKVFHFTLIFSIYKAIILIFLMLIKAINVYRFNIPMIVPEFDTQYIFSFLSVITFILYLLNSQKKYLLISAFLFIMVLLSMMRSTTFPPIIALCLVMIISIVKTMPIIARKYIAITGILLVITIIVLTKFPDSRFSFSINRFMGIVYSPDEASNVAFSDTGHKEQSITTFISALNQMRFWGIGYGRTNERLYLYGQSVTIHNNYALIWAQHGVLSLLFILIMFIITVKYFLILVKKINKNNFREYIIYLTVGCFLIAYFVAASFHSGNVFMESRLQPFWFLMFIYLTKCSVFKKNQCNFHVNAA